MVPQYKEFTKRVFDRLPQFKLEWKDDDNKWLPLRVIETLKNPESGLAQDIPLLSHLAGIAGLLDPTSADTKRLVKEHKYVTQ